MASLKTITIMFLSLFSRAYLFFELTQDGLGGIPPSPPHGSSTSEFLSQIHLSTVNYAYINSKRTKRTGLQVPQLVFGLCLKFREKKQKNQNFMKWNNEFFWLLTKIHQERYNPLAYFWIFVFLKFSWWTYMKCQTISRPA